MSVFTICFFIRDKPTSSRKIKFSIINISSIEKFYTFVCILILPHSRSFLKEQDTFN